MLIIKLREAADTRYQALKDEIFTNYTPRVGYYLVIKTYVRSVIDSSVEVPFCISPLKDWTKFRKQFRTIKLGNHEKRKKGVHP